MDRLTRLAAQQALAAKDSVVVVEVLEARGSAPRAAGTRMLVRAERAVGTIGGGHRVDPPLRAPATPEAILDALDHVRGAAPAG